MGRHLGGSRQRRNAGARDGERCDSGHEPREGRRAGARRLDRRRARQAARRRLRRAEKRPWPRGGGLRQRRRPRPCGRLDRRSAAAAAERRRLAGGPLARGIAAPVRPGNGRHGRPPRRPPARPSRTRRVELPLLRGPAAPLRTRQGHARRRARRPLPRRQGHAPPGCCDRPHRHGWASARNAPHRDYDPPSTTPLSESGQWRPEGGLAAREARPAVPCLRPEGGGSWGNHGFPHAHFPHAHFPHPGSRPAAPRVSSTTSIRRFDERTCSRASVRAARALPAEIASRIARCWRSFFA